MNDKLGFFEFNFVTCNYYFFLGGNYANFGVFELYGDKSLFDAVNTGLQLCLDLDIHELMVSFFSSAFSFVAWGNSFNVLCCDI